jgi:hypothetical protein
MLRAMVWTVLVYGFVTLLFTVFSCSARADDWVTIEGSDGTTFVVWDVPTVNKDSSRTVYVFEGNTGKYRTAIVYCSPNARFLKIDGQPVPLVRGSVGEGIRDVGCNLDA